MRDLHLAYFKSGVPSLDTIQDHAFFGAMYKYVEENNFKFNVDKLIKFCITAIKLRENSKFN